MKLAYNYNFGKITCTQILTAAIVEVTRVNLYQFNCI